MISKEAASINESDGKMIRIIEGAAFINLPEKRFGGVVESDGLYCRTPWIWPSGHFRYNDGLLYLVAVCLEDPFSRDKYTGCYTSTDLDHRTCTYHPLLFPTEQMAERWKSYLVLVSEYSLYSHGDSSDHPFCAL